MYFQAEPEVCISYHSSTYHRTYVDTSKYAGPVVRLDIFVVTVLRITPDVAVTIGVVFRFAALLEPFVLIARMIDHDIKENLFLDHADP